MHRKLKVPMWALIVGMLLISACGGKITDVSIDARYSHILGSEFTTNMDLAILAFKDSPQEYRLDEFDTQDVPNIETINGNYPYEYYGNIIHGILPKGSVFKVVKIEHEDDFESSYTWYHAVVVSEGQFKGNKINVSYLVGVGDDPEFLNKYAVKVAAQ